uniref:Uncharacterized protein n=1 Tax=Bionectria ochroleuca TaxID=29856 RepID=A0A8H7N7D3_BIOOC
MKENEETPSCRLSPWSLSHPAICYPPPLPPQQLDAIAVHPMDVGMRPIANPSVDCSSSSFSASHVVGVFMAPLSGGARPSDVGIRPGSRPTMIVSYQRRGVHECEISRV